MGVVTVSSSASRTSPIGVGAGFSAGRSQSLQKRCVSVVAFKSQDPAKVKTQIKSRKQSKRPQSVSLEAAVSSPSSTAVAVDLDYSEVAETLENIYRLSPTEASDMEVDSELGRRDGRQKKREDVGESGEGVVGSRKRRIRRLSLDTRIVLRGREKECNVVAGECVRKNDGAEERVNNLLRKYSISNELGSLDWKKMKIPPVLSSAEHKWLFNLMQPMKAMCKVKENLQKDLGREPNDGELAEAVNMSVTKLKRDLNAGHAARNKIIKHNLRLVLFVINKHFQDIANASRFNDLCQAGVKGLITSIDRFEPKRDLRLSTYAFFWIRHSIVRSMTLSSFTRVSFGVESVRQDIKKAKLELAFELQRPPSEEEIIGRVRISPERYYDVMKASKAVSSLNGRHFITQEEFINEITDAGVDKYRLPILRLAIDDVSRLGHVSLSLIPYVHVFSHAMRYLLVFRLNALALIWYQSYSTLVSRAHMFHYLRRHFVWVSHTLEVRFAKTKGELGHKTEIRARR